MPGVPSTTSYAVLGLLSLRDWTTYELAKQVQRSLNWFWPRTERKLYDEPKKLVELGFATATHELTGRRGRTVYAITDQGRSALRSWLGEPPEPRGGEFAGMVKVFFADAGSHDQLLSTLDLIEEEAGARLAMIAEFAASEMPFPRRLHLRAIGLALQHEQEAAIQRWATWAHRQVETWTDADDPGPWNPDAVLTRLAAGASAVD